jgi:dihydrofolate reductase
VKFHGRGASGRNLSAWRVLGQDRHEEDAVRDRILKMSMSIDGFVGGADGGIQWVFDGDQEATAWIVETVSNAGLHIMGSRTFHDMAAYWPTSTDVFASPMNRIPKAVFSRQGPAILRNANTTTALRDARANAGAGQTGDLQPGAESWAKAYVASGELAEEVAKLKDQEGNPIVAHGGASFARSLVAQGLVDQFELLVHPVALGRGLPIFSELSDPMRLKLMSAKAFPGGSVAHVYRAVS